MYSKYVFSSVMKVFYTLFYCQIERRYFCGQIQFMCCHISSYETLSVFVCLRQKKWCQSSQLLASLIGRAFQNCLIVNNLFLYPLLISIICHSKQTYVRYREWIQQEELNKKNKKVWNKVLTLNAYNYSTEKHQTNLKQNYFQLIKNS